MRQVGPKRRITKITGILLPLGLLHGCGGFAFYEDTKVAIAIKVDPKAPDPVEISASFKESVFALVPVGRNTSESGPPTLVVGPVLSDFDVRYGVNAQRPNPNYLFAAITHGAATGRAATLLRQGRSATIKHERLVLTAFLRQLSETDIKTAASSAAPMPRRCAANHRVNPFDCRFGS
jgi:hypothetical protein